MSGSPYEAYGQALARVPTAYAPQPQPLPGPYYAPYATTARPSVWETYRGLLAPAPEPFTPLESAVTGIRHNGEGMAIAALLALYQRHVGSLDFRGKYPIDGILGAALLALSVKESGRPNGFASDLRALSQSCTSVMMYRKILGNNSDSDASLRAQNKGNSATPLVSGDIPRNTSDPVLQAARKCGF